MSKSLVYAHLHNSDLRSIVPTQPRYAICSRAMVIQTYILHIHRNIS